MTRALLIGLGAVFLASQPYLVSAQVAPTTPPATAEAIPDRPEKLSFPPLEFEPPSPASYRVALRSGPVAYLVPDRELPLVNLVIYVHAGAYLEPPGKAGLAGLSGYLLARGGTRSRTAQELEERLAFLAARLESGVEETQGSVSLNLLSKDLDEGLAILKEVLVAPRFEKSRIVLRKQQLIADMKKRNDDAAAIEAREQGFLAYGEGFWANRYPTEASVNSISRSDLESFHSRWFHPSNFVVAASGDFDRAQMEHKLETLFGNWPFAGQVPPPVPTNTTFATPGVYIVDKDINQGRVSMFLPGIMRDNPDYFPAIVMDDILGAGGFTSRIVNRVRSDEGLAYDAHSSFSGGIYYPLIFEAGYQSKSRTVAYAAELVLGELRRMAAEPVTDAELQTAQQGFIGRFPRFFATKAQVASILATEEFTGRRARDPEYLQEYRARFQAVTKEDIQRVARKYLTTDKMVMLVVGQKEEILRGDPGHPVNLAGLAGGKLVDVPLRDPLTMKPLPMPAQTVKPARRSSLDP
jgi:predicted Zn-dependent peptidase